LLTSTATVEELEKAALQEPEECVKSVDDHPTHSHRLPVARHVDVHVGHVTGDDVTRPRFDDVAPVRRAAGPFPVVAATLAESRRRRELRLVARLGRRSNAPSIRCQIWRRRAAINSRQRSYLAGGERVCSAGRRALNENARKNV